MNPRLGFRPRILAGAILVLASAVPVSAQVDPLLFIKKDPKCTVPASRRNGAAKRGLCRRHVAPDAAERSDEPGDGCHVARDQPLLRPFHLPEECGESGVADQHWRDQRQHRQFLPAAL